MRLVIGKNPSGKGVMVYLPSPPGVNVDRKPVRVRRGGSAFGVGYAELIRAMRKHPAGASVEFPDGE